MTSSKVNMLMLPSISVNGGKNSTNMIVGTSVCLPRNKNPLYPDLSEKFNVMAVPLCSTPSNTRGF